MYDAIIIGAGPSGTAAAYGLASAGYRVLLLDRQVFPRKKACAGGMTPKAMALLPYDISHLVLRTCWRVKIVRPGGKSLTVKDKDPLCYMVQRKDLDQFSLTRARAAGAEFRVIDKMICLDQADVASGVGLTVLENGKKRLLKARFLVGADGANSRIRRLLSGREHIGEKPRARIIKLPALEADVKVADPRDYSMTLDFSKGIRGYYWIFPKNDHVNIGVYTADPRVGLHRGLLSAYALKHLGHARLEAVKGYPIGTGSGSGPTMPAGKGSVLLVGDAAGLAEPLLGEGIYMALRSGQLAAVAIGRALGVPGGDALPMYHASLARLRLDLWFYHRTASLMYRFPRECLNLARMPLILHPFSRGYAAGKTLSQILLPF